MNEITFKVAPRGEGKTKWLLEIAKRYADEGRTVYLFTDDDQDYSKFCEKYFNIFKTVCPIQRLTAFKLSPSDVVLVDNLFRHCTSIGDLTFIQRNCYRMFITIEGTTTFVENTKTWDDFYEQLTMDIQEVIRA